MKPKTNDPQDPGMLEYLEDIIGTYKYKEEIVKIEMDLQKWLEGKSDKLERLKISEFDLVQLEDQKQGALEYIKTEKQYFQILNIQFQIERYKANQEIQKYETKFNEVETNLRNERKAHKDKLKENEDHVSELGNIKKELDENEREKNECTRKYEDLNIKDAKVQNDKKHQHTQLHKHEKLLQELEEQYQDTIATTGQIESELPEKQARLDELHAQKEQEEEKLKAINFKLRNQTEELREEKEEVEKKLAPFVIRQNEIKNKLDELKNELALLTRRKKNAEVEANEIATRIEQFEKTLEENLGLDKLIDETLNKLNEITEETKQAQKDLKTKEEALLAELHEINVRLEEYKQNFNENRAQSHIASELLKAQRKQELSGICGRLGDLGTINDKYDVAITTASP